MLCVNYSIFRPQSDQWQSQTCRYSSVLNLNCNSIVHFLLFMVTFFLCKGKQVVPKMKNKHYRNRGFHYLSADSSFPALKIRAFTLTKKCFHTNESEPCNYQYRVKLVMCVITALFWSFFSHRVTVWSFHASLEYLQGVKLVPACHNRYRAEACSRSGIAAWHRAAVVLLPEQEQQRQLEGERADRFS